MYDFFHRKHRIQNR